MKKKVYTTIPVLVEVKAKLDAFRNNMDWSEFLLRLVEENIRLKKIIAARSIQERFNSKIEASIRDSITKMRRLDLRRE